MTMPRAAVLTLVATLALTACVGSSGAREPAGGAQVDPGRINARPGRGGGNCAAGEHTLMRLGNGRTAIMRVTLVLALHGAGGGSRDGLYAFRGGWDTRGLVVVAPSSWGSTWSVLRGPDIDLQFIDQALARAFARCRIDPRRVGVGGFSDGATYALTLGLTNGDLFRAVLALSPGGVLAENAVGKPRVFISHGANDTILPRSRTSDVIVRELRKFGYRVTYRKFQGGHEAPPAISREAVRWFLGR
jgi:phospholipase/carboxylesterase